MSEVLTSRGHESDVASRDRAALRTWLRALQATKSVDKDAATTLGSIVNSIAHTSGDQTALIDESGEFSYRDLASRANKYARWALAEGIAPGTVVGLLLGNCADYVAIWLGLTQAGCVVALVNTNLVQATLAHAIGTAGCSHLIVAAELYERVRAVATELHTLQLWVYGAGADSAVPRFDLAMQSYGGDEVDPADRCRPRGRDPALLIYTSGTTGRPKAANVSHARILQWSYWFAGLMDSASSDRLYNCLPMYHSTGGVIAVGAMLVHGGSVVIRSRFSASRFWADVVQADCTIFQYIGELCRYLLHAPPHPLERQHRLRLCCGNGLRGDIWQRFQHRFALPQILEFYASTEGAVSLYNCEGKPGAIGRVPGFLAHRFPIALVRCDPTTGELVRDAAGRCTRCDLNEPGEAIGQLDPTSPSPARRFEGYADSAANQQKIARDVFQAGDTWYRSGDLLRRDGDGFFYFVDRLGETFRWKGENVSASEVASIVAASPGIVDAVVYGVEIPGVEGRAGMAAVVPGPGFNLVTLRRRLREVLPDYARPLFVRTCHDIERTGTFKLMTGKLAREGYRPMMTTDAVWFDDRQTESYIVCNDDLLHRINTRAIRI